MGKWSEKAVWFPILEMDKNTKCLRFYPDIEYQNPPLLHICYECPPLLCALQCKRPYRSHDLLKTTTPQLPPTTPQETPQQPLLPHHPDQTAPPPRMPKTPPKNPPKKPPHIGKGTSPQSVSSFPDTKPPDSDRASRKKDVRCSVEGGGV